MPNFEAMAYENHSKREVDNDINSLQLKSEIIKVFGSKIDAGEFADIREFRFEDGNIISIDFAVRPYKYEKIDAPIVAQIENGINSLETTWEGLQSEERSEILHQLFD